MAIVVVFIFSNRKISIEGDNGSNVVFFLGREKKATTYYHRLLCNKTIEEGDNN
jgi:hypothetical protein